MPVAQLVHIGSMYVPGLRDVLSVQPIGLDEWATMLAIAIGLLALEEAHKAWRRRTGRTATVPQTPS